MFHNWIRLKNNCPLDITDLCYIGRDLNMDIEAIKQGSRDNRDILFVKSKLDRLIKRFLGIISEFNNKEGDEKDKKERKIIEHDFREAYARILGNIDKKEEELKKGDKIDDISLPLYVSEIDSVLIGDVYDTIKIASEKYPKDKEGFVYKAFELVNKSAMVFGAESRFKPIKKGKEVTETFEVSPPITAEEMRTKMGKEKLREKYDKTFKDFGKYEDLKKK